LFIYHFWLTNLRILEIDEVKTGPYTPMPLPFVGRRIVHIGVTAHPIVTWIKQQMTEAFPRDTAPR
jgi:hypothetical protein